MLYLSYWFSVTQTLALKYICIWVTYISWSSDFDLYLEDFKTIWWILGILVLLDTKIYLIRCLWVSELHVMVQWVRLVSCRLFDEWKGVAKRKCSQTDKIEFHNLPKNQNGNNVSGKSRGQLCPSTWSPGYHKRCEQNVRQKADEQWQLK